MKIRQEQHPWFRSRSYIHFDRPILLKKAIKIVTNPQQISTHAFYPFISYTIDSKKIKQDTKTKIIETIIKKRPVAYASHIDSHIYAYYRYKLSSLYESKINEKSLNDCVLAFRSLGKSNIEFADNAFTQVKKLAFAQAKNLGECSVSVLALDVSKFFDTLDHKILKKHWSTILSEKHLPPDHYNVYKSLTKFSTVDKHRLYGKLGISLNNTKKNKYLICSSREFRDVVRKSKLIEPNKTQDKGIPQGSPISALLSNIYMLEFDDLMNRFVNAHNGKYYRYCDDMLFIVPTKKNDRVKQINCVKKFASQAIEELNLEINKEKTEIRHFKYEDGVLVADKSLQYLGFVFDGENTYIRSSSLARYSERMKKSVKLAKATMDKRNKARTRRGENTKPLFKSKLYSRYSHFGSRNFITYGLRASKIMKSKSIKNQLKPHWLKLKNEIEKNH